MIEAHTASGLSYLVPGLPFELDGLPVGQPGDVAAIGADTVSILTELEFSPAEIEQFHMQDLASNASVLT